MYLLPEAGGESAFAKLFIPMFQCDKMAPVEGPVIKYQTSYACCPAGDIFGAGYDLDIYTKIFSVEDRERNDRRVGDQRYSRLLCDRR